MKKYQFTPNYTSHLGLKVPILSMGRLLLFQRFKSTMRAIQGSLIVASTLQIVLGFSGLWRNVAR